MSTASKAIAIATSSIVVVLLALIFVKTYFIGFYHIPQNGMFPSLLPGDRLFTARRAYPDASSVKRGDIVVFVREENGLLYNYIWRVVALPGEKIEASGQALTINGQPVQRKRVREAGGSTVFQEQIGDATYEVAFDTSPRFIPPDTSITVPPDQFFVMGDNRFQAIDSRYFGTITFSSIIGKKL
jgi:signal peptidase I